MVQVDDDHLFDEKRCPFGRSAMECIDILVDYMEISTGFCTSTHPEYLFFEMDQVFVTLIKCFNKLWVEMDAVSGGEDLMRVMNAEGN